MSATPRPWLRAGKYVWKSGKKNANVCACGEPHKGDFVDYTELSISSPDFEEAQANAALIVRAVNAHDDLVETLRDIEGMIAGCPDVPQNPDSLVQMVLAHARAALAKAETDV